MDTQLSFTVLFAIYKVIIVCALASKKRAQKQPYFEGPAAP